MFRQHLHLFRGVRQLCVNAGLYHSLTFDFGTLSGMLRLLMLAMVSKLKTDVPAARLFHLINLFIIYWTATLCSCRRVIN